MSVPASQLQIRATPSIKALAQELVDRISELSYFSGDGGTWYIFNEADAARITRFQEFPLAAVAYAGMTVLDRSPDSNPNCGRRATDTDMVFDVLLGQEYQAIDAENTLPSAVDILDAVREHLLGFKGVHTRVWRLAGETPIAGELEGVVWYGQQWVTRVSHIGDFVNSQ